MRLNHRFSILVAALSSAGLLAGCNGGGGGSGSGVFSVSATPNVAAVAGQTIALNGYASTSGQGIASASWQQVSGQPVQLSNSNCAQKSSSNASSAGTASAPAGAVLGSYVCPLSVTLPQSASGGSYTFRFTATDSAGNQQTALSTVTASATQTQPLIATAGPSANLYPNQKYTGHCQSTGGGYNAGQTPTYQWSITGPSGVNLPALSASGPAVQLTAPVLANNTNFALTCQVSDGIGNTATGAANLTVYGTSALPPLVANAGSAQIVNTASPVTLTATASASGSAPTAPVYYYWKQTGGKNTVTIANANTANASFVSPGTPTPAKPASGASTPAPSIYDTLTFTVYASYQPIDPTNLTAVPAAQTAQTVVTVVKQ